MPKKLAIEEVIARAREIHGDKYDYSLFTEYINNKTKIPVICKIHGIFYVTPKEHTGTDGTGCPVCAGFQKLSTEEFIKRSQLIHDNKYDYSKVNYTNSENKVIIICPIHGEFEQSARIHLKGHGCPKCVGLHHCTTEEFIAKARLKHGDKFDYSKVNYVNVNTKVTIICPIHGEFEQLPGGHLHQKYACKQCAYENISRKDRDKMEEEKKITKKIRSSVEYCFKLIGSKKSSHTFDLLDFTPDELIYYLKNHPNYEYVKNKYDLDHVYPIVAFIRHGLKDETYFHIINSLDNFQPMNHKENKSKNDYYNVPNFISWILSKGIKESEFTRFPNDIDPYMIRKTKPDFIDNYNRIISPENRIIIPKKEIILLS